MEFKKKRTRKNICLLLCLCSVACFIFGYLHQPSVASITLLDNFRAGVWNQEFDSRLVFFNDDEYDPANLAAHFPGSTIKKSFHFSAIPGIYYRCIQTDIDTHWVCQFSLWYPFVVFGILLIYFQLQENFYRNLPGETDSDDTKRTH